MEKTKFLKTILVLDIPPFPPNTNFKSVDHSHGSATHTYVSAEITKIIMVIDIPGTNPSPIKITYCIP